MEQWIRYLRTDHPLWDSLWPCPNFFQTHCWHQVQNTFILQSFCWAGWSHQSSFHSGFREIPLYSGFGIFGDCGVNNFYWKFISTDHMHKLYIWASLSSWWNQYTKKDILKRRLRCTSEVLLVVYLIYAIKCYIQAQIYVYTLTRIWLKLFHLNHRLPVAINKFLVEIPWLCQKYSESLRQNRSLLI